jgi:hypothetical protein
MIKDLTNHITFTKTKIWLEEEREMAQGERRLRKAV